MDSIRVDFDDTAHLEHYQPYTAITHSFAQPGIHVVTVSAQSGVLPVTQKVKIRVGE